VEPVKGAASDKDGRVIGENHETQEGEGGEREGEFELEQPSAAIKAQSGALPVPSVPNISVLSTRPSTPGMKWGEPSEESTRAREWKRKKQEKEEFLRGPGKYEDGTSTPWTERQEARPSAAFKASGRVESKARKGDKNSEVQLETPGPGHYETEATVETNNGARGALIMPEPSSQSRIPLSVSATGSLQVENKNGQELASGISDSHVHAQERAAQAQAPVVAKGGVINPLPGIKFDWRHKESLKTHRRQLAWEQGGGLGYNVDRGLRTVEPRLDVGGQAYEASEVARKKEQERVALVARPVKDDVYYRQRKWLASQVHPKWGPEGSDGPGSGGAVGSKPHSRPQDFVAKATERDAVESALGAFVDAIEEAPRSRLIYKPPLGVPKYHDKTVLRPEADRLVKARKMEEEGTNREWTSVQFHRDYKFEDVERERQPMAHQRSHQLKQMQPGGTTLGPGDYDPEHPEWKWKETQLDMDKQVARRDAVGPFGERPDAAFEDPDGEEDVWREGDILDLHHHHQSARPTKDAPAFTFARAPSGREADYLDSDGEDDEYLVLEPNYGVGKSKANGAFLSFARQLGRADSDADGDAIGEDVQRSGDNLNLDIEKSVRYLENRQAASVAFSKVEVGARLEKLKTHKDLQEEGIDGHEGDIIPISPKRGEDYLRVKPKSGVSFAAQLERWADDTLLGEDDEVEAYADNNRYTEAEYEVERGMDYLSKYDSTMARSAVNMSTQRGRWDDEDQPHEDNNMERAPSPVYSPKWEVSSRKRNTKAGVVNMSTQRDRWEADAKMADDDPDAIPYE
jgi:hypothetical protein